MKNTLLQIRNGLESFDIEVQQNMEFMLNRYSTNNWKNLSKEEQRTNRLDIYRSIDSYNCGFVCFEVDDKEETFHQLEDELEFGQNDIFSSWDKIWDLDKSADAIEKYGEIFYVELEILYLSWIIKNWNIAKEGKEIEFQYCITENNSQRSFDLNILNWDNYINNYNYNLNDYYIYSKLPKEDILRKRILIDFLGNEIKELIRIFEKGSHQIIFQYDDWSVKFDDNQGKVMYESNFKQRTDKYVIQHNEIKKMISKMNHLLKEGYKEKENER